MKTCKKYCAALLAGSVLLSCAGCSSVPGISFRLAGTSGPGLTISFDLTPGTNGGCSQVANKMPVSTETGKVSDNLTR
jgi:hypothetical protein